MLLSHLLHFQTALLSLLTSLVLTNPVSFSHFCPLNLSTHSFLSTFTCHFRVTFLSFTTLQPSSHTVPSKKMSPLFLLYLHHWPLSDRSSAPVGWVRGCWPRPVRSRGPWQRSGGTGSLAHSLAVRQNDVYPSGLRSVAEPQGEGSSPLPCRGTPSKTAASYKRTTQKHSHVKHQRQCLKTFFLHTPHLAFFFTLLSCNSCL